MADVVVDAENKSSKELLGQGIRAYILQDFTTAVAALSKASELLVAEHGDDLHESLGDVYLYYGKALLGLSREESEALGDAVPKNNEEESDEDEGEEVEAEDGEEKDGEKMETVDEEKKGTEDAEKDAENGETKANGNGDVDNEAQEKEKESSEPTENDPSSSAKKDEAEEKNGEEEPTDLQLAWEVLELAKKIFQKRGQEGKKNLAETMTVLGEISLESENFEAAIKDIQEGFEIQKELFGKDSRTVAETFYKLGMAYSTNSQIDEAVESFKSSLEYLQNRISQLENVQNEKNAALEEINEIKNLIPDIEEKIADMKSYKDETLKKIMSAVTEQRSDSTASSSQSSSKPATDISHLVKRKRKLDEIVEDCEKEAESSPAKKPPV